MKKWKKYTKKPVVVEAYIAEDEEYIDTLEGTMKANVGDYVIKGIQGELYPCKPDIFKETYELSSYEELKDNTIKEFCSQSSMEEILGMLRSEFKYGVVNYREDGLVEVSACGWSEDEGLIREINNCWNVLQYYVGRINATHYYVLSYGDRYKYDVFIKE